MLGESSTAKSYRPISLLSVVSKAFEKLVNNRMVDHLENCGLFSDFHYGFRSSRSTADLLTVVSDRIARAFNRSGATRAVAPDISKAFENVWHALRGEWPSGLRRCYRNRKVLGSNPARRSAGLRDPTSLRGSR